MILTTILIINALSVAALIATLILAPQKFQPVHSYNHRDDEMVLIGTDGVMFSAEKVLDYINNNRDNSYDEIDELLDLKIIQNANRCGTEAILVFSGMNYATGLSDMIVKTVPADEFFDEVLTGQSLR